MSEFRFYLFKRTKLSSVLKKKKWRNHVVTGCLKKENETLPPKPPAMQSPGHSAQRFALRCPGRGPGTGISSRFPGDRTLGQEWDPSPSPQREGEAWQGQRTGVSRAPSSRTCWARARPRATAPPLCGPNPRTPTLRLRRTGEGTGARLAGSTGSSRRPVRPLTSRPPPSLELPRPSRPPPSTTFSPRSRRGRLAAHVCLVRLYNYLPPNEVINSLRAGTTSSLMQQRWKDT